jgi:hypothetical protein
VPSQHQHQQPHSKQQLTCHAAGCSSW